MTHENRRTAADRTPRHTSLWGADVRTNHHDGGMADEGAEATYPPSPVLSDVRLWPMELPFTAFGQFDEGALDLRVFDQDIYWVDRLGVSHPLKEMSQEYIANVIAFLVEGRVPRAVLCRYPAPLVHSDRRGPDPVR